MLARCERDCKWHDRTWTDPSPLHSQWRQHVSLQTFPQSSHRMFVTEVLIYQHCIPRHAANLQETMLREVAPSRVPWGGHGAPHALYFSPEADSPMHRRRFSGVIKQVHGHLVGDDFLPKKSFLENGKGMAIRSVRIGRSLRHRHHARSFPSTISRSFHQGRPQRSSNRSKLVRVRSPWRNSHGSNVFFVLLSNPVSIFHFDWKLVSQSKSE